MPEQGGGFIRTARALLVEPRGPNKCRFVSRYRVNMSADWRTRLGFGQWLVEPVGFEMDRRMLLGVKDRAEREPPRTVAA